MYRVINIFKNFKIVNTMTKKICIIKKINKINEVIIFVAT